MLYYLIANSVLYTEACSETVGKLLHLAKRNLQRYARSVHDPNNFEAESFELEYLLLDLQRRSSQFEEALGAKYERWCCHSKQKQDVYQEYASWYSVIVYQVARRKVLTVAWIIV